MAGGGEEARLSEIGPLRHKLGGLQRLARPLALGDVVEHHQDLPRGQGLLANLQRVHEQRSHSPRRQLDVDFEILDDLLAAPKAIEKAAQRLDIEAVIIDRVELSTHGLPRLDRKGAVEGTARRDDAKLLIEHDERLANGVDDAVGIGPRRLDCPFGCFPVGYVGEGDNHPLNPIVLGPVGQNATGVPRSIVPLDFAVRRHLAGENRVGVGEQASVVDAAGQVGERPADVHSDDAKHRLRRWREKTDLEILVQEQHRDLGAVHGVLQVVGGGALALDGFVELTVEGGELLVERLQLFLGSFQFFVGRLQLLVDGHRLFVGGRQFVIGCLEVVDCALQFLASGIEFLLELDDMRRVGLGPFLAAFLALGFVGEADQKKLFALGVKRLDRDAHGNGIAVPVHLRAPDCDAGMLLAGLADRRPELRAQSVARHGE